MRRWCKRCSDLTSKITNAAKAIPNVQSTIFHFVAYLGVLHSTMRLSSDISVHRVMFNPGRTAFNCAAFLLTYHVRVDSQRVAWVTVPQLLLHHSRHSA